MNVIRKLTWQYMKKNKRRTIVTVIGIITVSYTHLEHHFENAGRHDSDDEQKKMLLCRLCRNGLRHSLL